MDLGLPIPRSAGRNHRHEERTVFDLLADLRIPRVAADEFALVEPHFDARGAKGVANLLRRFGVLLLAVPLDLALLPALESDEQAEADAARAFERSVTT